MSAPPSPLLPLILAPLILWRLFRYFRRSTGRQRIQRRRLTGYMFLLGGLSLILAIGCHNKVPALGGLMGGLVVGGLVALIGLRHTVFENAPDGNYFTPHTYIGLAVAALFIGRVLYRLVAIYITVDAPAPNAASMGQNPLTLFLFGVTSGYYLAYYSGVLQRDRLMAAPAGAGP